MNVVLKIFLSVSFSGTLLILALFWGERFLKDKISRQWQYYIWLIVILRLLLPFGPEANLLGKTYQSVERAITQSVPLPQQNFPMKAPEGTSAVDSGWNDEDVNSLAGDLVDIHPIQDMVSLLISHIWLIWLAAALGMLIRKITIYQGFIQYIKAGLSPVSDMGILNQLSIAAKEAGIKKPVELGVNPLISSPLLIGFFHPYIVLPGADISERDFRYIALHELTHFKRRDMFYKWLIQVTVCLHWFNPFVYLMSREIAKACEFSCDEAVLEMEGINAQDYGKTLLDAMAAVGKYKENLGAVTLSENKQLLKERLGAIMRFENKSKGIRLLPGVLTLCIILGAAFVGVYPVAAASNDASGKSQTSGLDKKDAISAQKETDADGEGDFLQIEKYYEAGSLPLFQIAFSRLDEEAQGEWMDRVYADGEIAFFDIAVKQLDADSPLIEDFAKKFYEDDSINFFSVLANQMSDEALETWLDRALEDREIAFQSVLFKQLDKEDELDALEEEWAKEQLAEYQAAGVTHNGKNYYYKEQLVNVFLDIRPNKSFYTLDMNPAGTVNIKILRGEDGQITGVAYMTAAEVEELFGDMNEPDDF